MDLFIRSSQRSKAASLTGKLKYRRACLSCPLFQMLVSLGSSPKEVWNLIRSMRRKTIYLVVLNKVLVRIYICIVPSKFKTFKEYIDSPRGKKVGNLLMNSELEDHFRTLRFNKILAEHEDEIMLRRKTLVEDDE